MGLGLVAGVRAPLTGLFRILRDPALRAHLTAPLLLTAVVYLVFFAAAAFYSPTIVDWLWHRPEGGSRFLWLLLVPLVFALCVVVLGLAFVTVALLIGGPFYQRMVLYVLQAAGVEAREPRWSVGALNDLAVAICLILPSTVCAVLALVPAIGVAFAAIGAVLSSLGLAISATSPTLLSMGMPVGARLRSFAGAIPFLLGLGAMLSAAMAIPLLILIALPSAMVGAAEAWTEKSRSV
jgi:uncharacterized protein involved in cysteine biosynthesis